MNFIKNEIERVPYLYDRSGRIWIKHDKVLRIIDDVEKIKDYIELLAHPKIENLFEIGLVRTEIPIELQQDTFLIMQHEKIPFILHPCEYTTLMYWQAAKMFIQLNQNLCRLGFITSDSHPWNISYSGSRPVFFDFGSINKGNEIKDTWLSEFYRYFIVPIWLASYSKKTYKFSKEYRREHSSGFGLEFFNSTKIRRNLFRKIKGFYKFLDNPEKLFSELLNWLDEHKPIEVEPEFWSNYYKSTVNDPSKPETTKQRFVYDVLNQVRPKKVLDLAANKGYYSKMAANVGASVIAFDFEEEVVNSIVENKNFKSRITPAHIDFKRPTSAMGAGLFWQDSYHRFKSDIVLALGLVHHICLKQKMPIYLFCETCKKYAEHGIILEFVDPTDEHVVSWNMRTPRDYSLETICSFLEDKFPNKKVMEEIKNNGICRTLIYFCR